MKIDTYRVGNSLMASWMMWTALSGVIASQGGGGEGGGGEGGGGEGWAGTKHA